MKACYTTANGRLSFEFESESDKTLFEDLAHIQELFEETSCGCCKSDRIRFDVREFDGNKYFKLHCEACGATLDFGQHKSGDSLFAKRWDKDAKAPLPNGGWYRYKDQQPQPAPAANHRTPAPVPKPIPPKATPSNTPASPPTRQPAARPTRPTIEDIHRSIVDGYQAARTAAELTKFVEMAGQHEFASHHQDEQADAYYEASERIGRQQSDALQSA